MNFKPIDIKSVSAQISYEPRTGIFRWKVGKRGHRQEGDVAGSLTTGGYWRVKVDQKTYAAARLAWVLHHGVDPLQEIDHKDGDPLNNRIRNLRPATRRQNCENMKGAGCRYEADRGKWLARITVNYKQINLGRYDTEAEGKKAYADACVRYRGEFARRP